MSAHSSDRSATKSTMSRLANLKPWKPGESGNPGGRPKQVVTLTELARTHTKAAVETLVAIMQDPNEAGASRVTAANSILDRAWGKPMQMVLANTEASPNALHLIAAQVISREIGEERANEGPPTISGETVTNETVRNSIDAPPALE